MKGVIIELDRLLGRIRQPPVTQNQPGSALFKIVSMFGGKAVGEDGNAQNVIRTTPPAPSHVKARPHGTVYLGKSEAFRFAVIPAQSGKGTNIIAQLLIPTDPCPLL